MWLFDSEFLWLCIASKGVWSPIQFLCIFRILSASQSLLFYTLLSLTHHKKDSEWVLCLAYTYSLRMKDRCFFFKKSDLGYHSFTHYCPFYCLNEIKNNFSDYIISFPLPCWPRSESLVIGPTLVLINIIIELVKGVSIKTLWSTRWSMLWIPLSSFILIN